MGPPKKIGLDAMSKDEIEGLFPKLDVSHIPHLKEYTWEEWHEGSLGAGDYFLADETAGKLGLQPGMRVLELGSGRGFNACFIAKHFGVNVYAADLFADPAGIMAAAEEKGVAGHVFPFKCNARNLPFARHFFDAVFSLNSYFYFGTDDTYLPYLSHYLKSGSLLCIAGPCFSREPDESTPEYFMFDAPDFIEYYAMHSPEWWGQHFSKYKNVKVLSCSEHPLGREIWLDSIRWQLQSRPLKDVLHDAKMLLSDQNRFVTYFSLLARISS